MSDLHLDSLEIKNFRCFEHLVIPKLGRVNLIVGKNGVGKTALLEAIRIFANHGSPATLLEILSERNESQYASIGLSDDAMLDSTDLPESNIDSAFKYLFYGRNYRVGETLSIGSLRKKSNNLSVGIDLYHVQDETEQPGQVIGPINPEDYSKYIHLTPRISIHIGNRYRHSMPLYVPGRRSLTARWTDKGDSIRCQSIPATGLRATDNASLWERIVLTGAEKEIIETLRKVINDLTGVAVVGFGKMQSFRDPLVIARIQDQEPIPIQSLGDGLLRTFGISLSLIISRNGFLLIDEFETGLHHSTQTDIWRIIFETAKRLNIQVFATTHSWDCIEAFQEAAAGDQNEEAMLIRLQRKRDGSGIGAEIYNERSMDIVTRQGIEVR